MPQIISKFAYSMNPPMASKHKAPWTNEIKACLSLQLLTFPSSICMILPSLLPPILALQTSATIGKKGLDIVDLVNKPMKNKEHDNIDFSNLYFHDYFACCCRPSSMHPSANFWLIQEAMKLLAKQATNGNQSLLC